MEHIARKRWTHPLVVATGLTLASCSGSARDLGDTEDALNTKTNDAPNDDMGAEGPSSPAVSPATTMCDAGEQDSFAEATTAVFGAEHLYGVWIDEVQVSDLGLPSGSKLATLTLAENHITLALGETEDPRPLLDGNLGSIPGAREGFRYTVIPGEVLNDTYPHPMGGVYPEAYPLIVAPSEVYRDLCAEQAPGNVMRGSCDYPCLPAKAVHWSVIEESDEEGVCLVDGDVEISCDDAKLCAAACQCDESGCYYNAFDHLELVLAVDESGTIDLYLPKLWTMENTAPTLGANGQVVAQLDRQP